MGSCGSRAPRCGPGVQSKISTWQGALARAGTPGHRWLLVRGAPAPAATGQGAPGRGHSALAGGRLCSSVHWPSPAGPSGSLSHTPRPGCCSSGLGGLGSGPECGRVCAPALRRHGRMRVLQGRCGRGPAPCQPSRVPPARSLPGRLATAGAGCWDRPRPRLPASWCLWRDAPSSSPRAQDTVAGFSVTCLGSSPRSGPKRSKQVRGSPHPPFPAPCSPVADSPTC